MSDHALYGTWKNIRSRCLNPLDSRYESYGGRGIKLCQEWQSGPAAFVRWSLASGYAPGLQVDRRDNDGNYEPGNCRWVARTVQQRNKRNNHILEFGGQARTLAEWSEIMGIGTKTLQSRVSRGWTASRALTVPGRTPELSRRSAAVGLQRLQEKEKSGDG
jgi:hypothetical protein